MHTHCVLYSYEKRPTQIHSGDNMYHIMYMLWWFSIEFSANIIYCITILKYRLGLKIGIPYTTSHYSLAKCDNSLLHRSTEPTICDTGDCVGLLTMHSLNQAYTLCIASRRREIERILIMECLNITLIWHQMPLRFWFVCDDCDRCEYVCHFIRYLLNCDANVMWQLLFLFHIYIQTIYWLVF